MSSEAYIKGVVLPSRGLCYPEGAIPGGEVTIEPMGTREEKIWAGGKSGAATVNAVYDSCVHLPGNFNHRDLVLGDRLFLLIQLRCVTYGADYGFSFRCQDCRKRASVVTQLDKLKVQVAPDGFAGRFTVELPLAQKILEMRLLTGKDDEAIDRYDEQMKKHGADNEAMTYRVARRITLVDGDEIQIRDAMNLINSLKGMDSLAITEAIDEHDVGPSMEVEVDCNHCGYMNAMTLPIDSEFFRPRRRRAGHRDPVETAVDLDDRTT